MIVAFRSSEPVVQLPVSPKQARARRWIKKQEEKLFLEALEVHKKEIEEIRERFPGWTPEK